MAEIVNDRDWLSKMDAARLLGVQIRQLEKREKQGFIRKRILPRRMNEKTASVRYSREDIEALRNGAPNHNGGGIVPEAQARPAKPAKKPAQETRVAVASPDPFAGLAAHLARLAEAFPPAQAQKPWLSLQEAADFSGLPAAWLLAQAQSGAIRAVDVGQGTRSFWRFNRADLAK